MKKVLMISLLFCSFFMIGCTGGSDTPTAAYEAMSKDAENNRWDRVYEAYSKETQEQIDMGMQLVLQMQIAFAGMMAESEEEAEEQRKKSEAMLDYEGRELFARIMKEIGEESPVGLDMGKVISEEVDGDTATLTVFVEGKNEKVTMIKEGGKWKVHEVSDPSAEGAIDLSIDDDFEILDELEELEQELAKED